MARQETDEREMAYRFYITDGFYAEGNNKRMSHRFYDLIMGNVKFDEDVDGDAIAEEVIRNAGLIYKE